MRCLHPDHNLQEDHLGHYRRLYESQSIELEAATTALRASKAEELRLTLALKETNSRVTRERERAENLQREVEAREGEVARLKQDNAALLAATQSLGVMRRSHEEELGKRYDRIRELDVEAARLKEELRTVQLKLDGLAGAVAVARFQEPTELVMGVILLERDDWHTRYHAAMQRVDDLEKAAPTPTVEACDKPHVERQRLPNDRLGKTFKLRIGLDEKLCPECKVPLPGSRVSGHLTLNRYPDGRLGEMFLALDRARRGDLAATFAHQFAIMVSIALQYHVPQKVIVERLKHVRDESGGYVIREEDGKLVTEEHAAGSLIDLIAVTMERFAAEVTP